MKTVGAFQAKAQLSRLLDDVARGETVTITRRGHPVAVLAPAKPERGRKTGETLLAEMKRLRKGVRLGDIKVKDLITEGRKY